MKSIFYIIIAMSVGLIGVSPVGDFDATGDIDPYVNVVELGSTVTVNEMSLTEIVDEYLVELGDEHYTLVSSARLANESDSLDAFKASHPKALRRMAELTGMPDLTESNAEEYAQAVIPIITAYEHNGESISLDDQQYALLVLDMCFLLMGDESSDELESALTELSSGNLGAADIEREIARLSQNAPALAGDNSDFVRASQRLLIGERSIGTNGTIMIPDIEGGGFSLTKANAYAQRYAANPNPDYRFFSRGDCANFVSQVMKAGGFTENSAWRYNSGNPTRSWSVANDFANRFGVVKKTTSLSTFTSRAVVGRPVGLYNGTRIYHVGYVMSKGSQVTQGGKTFRPLRIAQHSGNYYGWMHNGGNAKGWITVGAWVTP